MTYVEAAGLMPAGLGKPEGLGKEDDLLPAAGLTAATLALDVHCWSAPDLNAERSQSARCTRACNRLIESEVSVAVFAVAFRGPTGWLPNRMPTA